ncbi:MAG TPA: hypothetical protein VKQ70_06700 [Caulobacteraceae bacterium]|jgi:hypothetical protein|nr:hypothetical protein [Caulobacteraceae bacterium]
MSDGIALPALALLTIGLVALALVWPQGQGAPSPPPFGHRAAVMAGPVVLRGQQAASNLVPQPAPKPRL